MGVPQELTEEREELKARKILIRIAWHLIEDMNKAQSELEEATWLRSYSEFERINILKPDTLEGGLIVNVPEPEIFIKRINRALESYKSYYEALRHLDEHVRKEGLDNILHWGNRFHWGDPIYSYWPISLSAIN